MIRSFQEIRKELENRRGKKPFERDEEGRVTVDFRVLNDDAVLSPYSAENHNVLSAEMEGFISHSLSSVPTEEPVHLRIHSDVITPEEEKTYAEAIHEHYADCYHNARLEKRRLHIVALFMALVAVAALSVAIGLDVSGNRTAVLAEVIDIFAWVFMWEAVDIFFLQCTMLRFREKRYLALVDCVIEYLPLSNEEKQ